MTIKNTERLDINFNMSLDDINEKIQDKENNPGLYILIIRHLIEMDLNNNLKICKIDEIVNILIEYQSLKWRHVKVILNFLQENFMKEQTYQYFSKLCNQIQIDGKMIKELCEIDCNLLDYYLGAYVETGEKYDEYPINKISYNYDMLLFKMESFIKKKYSQKGLTNFLECIPEEKYDVVIDGNNLLLHKGKIDSISIEILHKVVKHFVKRYKCLTFIHPRNVKKIKKLGMDIKIDYVETLYNYNDDWFSLYYAIKNNSFICSRDYFLDHINQYDTKTGTNDMKIFLKSKKIHLQNDFKILETKSIIPIIIKEYDGYYIPGIYGYKKISI